MQHWICTVATACWAVWITTAKRSRGCVSHGSKHSFVQRWSGCAESRGPLYLTMEAGALTRWARTRLKNYHPITNRATDA
jgi:hypothetical protein